VKISKQLALVASVVLLGGSLAACGDSDDSSGSDSSGRTTVRLAFTPGATTLPVHLAETRGIFEKNGLDVEITEGLDLPTWAAGLGKQWDIAMSTPGVYLTGANQLDLDLIASGQVTTADSLSANPLIVRGDSIKDTVDLVGRTVGVATLTGSTVNSIKYLVAKEGGDPDDVKFVQVPFPAAGDQLKAGQIDATVSSIPFNTVILADPENHALFDVVDKALRTVDPDQEVMASIVYMSNDKWAKDNLDAATAFEKSLDEAQKWMDANKEEALDELAKWLGMPRDVIAEMDWPIPVQAEITQDMMQPSLDLLLEVGAVTEADAPDLSERFPLQ
jgi:NitT/TauT family transport system substrate-binding protein